MLNSDAVRRSGFALGAAVLVLSSWTVIIPPTRCQSGAGCNPYLDAEAPLSEWEEGHDFPTKSECDSFLGKARSQLTDPEGHRKAQAMRCISDEALRKAKHQE